jgi:hypothetical protein
MPVDLRAISCAFAGEQFRSPQLFLALAIERILSQRIKELNASSDEKWRERRDSNPRLLRDKQAF